MSVTRGETRFGAEREAEAAIGECSLHRIDPEVVKKEVEAAGFKLEGESNVLNNPADAHTDKVFEGSIKGKTDQFILKFRKPK